MKFCVVIGKHPEDTPGGAELQSHLISSELASRSHDCHYLAYDSDRQLPEEIDGVTVHSDRCSGYREIVRRADDLDCDVYYFRNMADLPLAYYTEKFIPGTVVYNISHDRQCIPLVGIDHTLGGTTIGKTYANSRALFYRSFLSGIDNLVVQTSKQQRALAQNRGIDATIVGNGQRAPDSAIEKESPPVVLWLASIKEWKRPELFADLAAACTDLPATFQIVGRPSVRQLANRIQRRAAGLQNLKYLGGCSIPESNEYIADASVFVNTSREEGFPNTFIQSWFRRTPVVSASVDPESALTDHEIGFLSGNFESLVEDVQKLVTDAELRTELGTNAYHYAKKNHDISVVVDRLETVLDR